MAKHSQNLIQPKFERMVAVESKDLTPYFAQNQGVSTYWTFDKISLWSIPYTDKIGNFSVSNPHL